MKQVLPIMICVVKMVVLVGGRNNFAQEKYKMQPDVKYYFQLFVTVKLTKLRTPKICLECLLWPIMISKSSKNLTKNSF